MSKKQIRYEVEDLLKKPELFPNRELNYVLRNKKVILGRIQSQVENKITVRNTFNKKITLHIDQILEIWGEEKITS